MLPLVMPGILTVALIIGLYSWNEFLIALTFLQKAERLTAVVSFALLSGQYSSDWGEIMAARCIIVLPVVVLFVLLQKKFIEGMAGGSVKGWTLTKPRCHSGAPIHPECLHAAVDDLRMDPATPVTRVSIHRKTNNLTRRE